MSTVVLENTRREAIVVDEQTTLVVEKLVTKVLEVGIVGPQGPPGASGATSTLYYEHTQNAPQTVWTIPHDLDAYPSVTIVDSAGTVVEGQLDYLDRNTVRATFTAAFSGSAYLS